MKNRIVTFTMVIVLILGADAAASARVLNLTHAGRWCGTSSLGSDKEHLGKVNKIKTKGPKRPDPPSMKDMHRPKPTKTLNKIKKSKKRESVQRVL
ncbi:MAG TPA: hypothetical protein VI756_31795 [Blastocatellia bacterium]